MSSSAQSPADTDSHAETDPPVVTQDGGGADITLAANTRWQGTYQVSEQLPDQGKSQYFKAVHIGSLDDVQIRSYSPGEEGAARAKVWAKLQSIKCPSLQEGMQALEIGAQRFEICKEPPSMTLRNWRFVSKPGPGEIEQMMKAMVEALGELHRNGLVHLNIRPDTIFVEVGEDGLRFVLGGLEEVAFFEQPDLVAIAVDNYYAPPEAVGQVRHPPGPGLRAWDWWSLGRVVQELVLGRHILGFILERDVTAATPELQARAQSLLQEPEASSTRAGAVEIMPAMERSTTSLLRGLLTSVRDARWGVIEVARWLRHEPVKERYQLSKAERLFIWKDQSYTIPEAADYFAKEENWADGIVNLFHTDNPTTLISFLGDGDTHAKLKERVDAILKFAESTAAFDFPAETVTDILTAMALRFLAGGNPFLVLRGRKVDEDCLKALLLEGADGVALVRTMMARSVTQQISSVASETARLLTNLSRVGTDVLDRARRFGWLTVGATEEAQLLGLAFKNESSLTESVEALRAAYACSQNPTLDTLFKSERLTQVDLTLLAYTAQDPSRFGYVTHADWNQEQYRKLSQRGAAIARAVFWLRVARTVGAGPLIFGSWKRLVAIWVPITLLIAFVRPDATGFILAPLPALTVWLGRWLALYWFREEVRHWAPGTEKWTFGGAAARSGAEAKKVLQTESLPEMHALLNVLREVNNSIAAINLNPRPAPVRVPAQSSGTWLMAIVGWLCFGLAVGGIGWRCHRHPPTADNFQKAWAQCQSLKFWGRKSASAAELKKAKKADESEEAPTVVKIKWSYKIPDEPFVAKIHRVLEASPAQAAQARQQGADLTEPFIPETITVLIAIHVPLQDSNTERGFMIYDANKAKLVDTKVYTVSYMPLLRSCFELGGRNVIYIGEEQ